MISERLVQEFGHHGVVQTHSFEVEIDIKISGRAASHLVAAAEKRNVDPAELMADVISAVLNDGLIDAVIDD